LGLSLLQDEISQAVQASKGSAAQSEREEHSNLLERLEKEQTEPNSTNESPILKNRSGSQDDDAIGKERYLEEWLILAREIYMSAESSVEVLNDLLNVSDCNVIWGCQTDLRYGN
jgi:hypothetical protein